jgi:hypothetical protein
MDDLSRSLNRAIAALERSSRAPVRAAPTAGSPPPYAMALAGAGMLLLVMGLVLQQHNLFKVGLTLLAMGAVLAVTNMARRGPPRPGVSMGASIGVGTQLDPTATVEMGASVGEGARLGPRAVVKMGANVEDGAVLEEAAVVGWGAHVGEGAVLGAGAVVGAGAEVGDHARVPAGFVLRPGSSFGGKEAARLTRSSARGASGSVEKAAPPAVADPRAARVEAACAKLDAELRASPESLRSFLGGSGETVEGLRRTCAELLRRESALRREADPGQLAEERAAIEARIEREQDGQIRDSLRGALAAIDGQKKERELLALAAERLGAEHTRLLYTIEQLAAQSARLRSAGEGATNAPQELQRGVQQLRGELEAIADALESVAVAPPDEEMAAMQPGQRSRTR